MTPVELTAENFDQIVLQEPNKAVLVDFWAVWCIPCQMLDPVTEFVAKDAAEYATVGKLNIDDFPQIAERYNIMSIPTMLIFYKGELVKQLIGIQEKDVIITALRDARAGI